MNYIWKNNLFRFCLSLIIINQEDTPYFIVLFSMIKRLGLIMLQIDFFIFIHLIEIVTWSEKYVKSYNDSVWN